MKLNPTLFGILFALQTFLIIFVLVFYYSDTIVSPYYCIPVFFVAILFFVFYRRKDAWSLVKSVAVGACVGADICLALLVLNYYCVSPHSSLEIYKCKVDKFATSYHSRSTYRRRAYGSSHMEYHYTIHTPYGEMNESTTKREKWQRLRRKQTITVEMQKGILGFPIMKAKY